MTDHSGVHEVTRLLLSWRQGDAEALDALSSFDSRQCRVVELRFFAGLNIPETADALGVSTATVEREWAMAKAWLHQRLSAPSEPAAE